MKLYHHTQRKHLLGIAKLGLTPNVPSGSLLTLNQAVVWLTRAKRAEWAPDEHKHVFEMCLPVRFEVRTKRLQHYLSWLRANKHVEATADDGSKFTTADLLAMPEASEPFVADWFVYFGTIAPDKVEFERTPANLLPGVEANLASAIAGGNAARIASLAKTREQMLGMPPDTPVSLGSELTAA